MIPVHILPHVVTRRGVLLIFPLVIAVFRKLLEELLLESQGQFVDANVEVTSGLGVSLLFFFCVDAEGLGFG